MYLEVALLLLFETDAALCGLEPLLAAVCTIGTNFVRPAKHGSVACLMTRLRIDAFFTSEAASNLLLLV